MMEFKLKYGDKKSWMIVKVKQYIKSNKNKIRNVYQSS